MAAIDTPIPNDAQTQLGGRNSTAVVNGCEELPVGSNKFSGYLDFAFAL
jgi:hypothetical protein